MLQENNSIRVRITMKVIQIMTYFSFSSELTIMSYEVHAHFKVYTVSLSTTKCN